MAGDWMKIELETPNKIEVTEMAEFLKVSNNEVIGMLVSYLAWLNQHCKDGELPTSSINYLNNLTGSTEFCNALSRVGWLQFHEDRIEVVNYERHNGKNAKERASNNRRVAKYREIKKLEEDGLSKEYSSDVTDIVLQEPIPEKRTEEKKIEENNPPSWMPNERLESLTMEYNNHV